MVEFIDIAVVVLLFVIILILLQLRKNIPLLLKGDFKDEEPNKLEKARAEFEEGRI